VPHSPAGGEAFPHGTSAARARPGLSPQSDWPSAVRRRAPLCTAVLLLGAPALAQVQSALTDPAVLAAGASSTTQVVASPAQLSGPLRVGIESGAGLLGGAAVGAFNAWAMQSLLQTQNNSPSTQRLVSLFGAPLGVSVGAPLAVTLSGYVLGENGSFLVSWLSALGGLAVGGGIYLTASGLSDSQAAKASYGFALLLPVVGAVLGYELSARAAPPLASGLTVVPSLAVSEKGAAAGVAGVF
jgi:hypothetical protein